MGLETEQVSVADDFGGVWADRETVFAALLRPILERLEEADRKSVLANHRSDLHHS